MRYIYYCAIVICMFLAAPGCAPDESQPQPQQKQKQSLKEQLLARKKEVLERHQGADKAADKSQEKKPAEPTYSYSSAGKADPFRPLIVDTAAKKASDSESRDREFLTPLQRYELKDLKLVAVVVSDEGPTAMLEDPTGYGYVVRAGMLVGPNNGVVERVTRTGIIVRETINNSLGEAEPRISTLTIQQVE
jgi:type IV pilus assembly protein PilP